MRFEQVSGEHELREVAMVRENRYRCSSPGEEMAVTVESVDDGVQLLRKLVKCGVKKIAGSADL